MYVILQVLEAKHRIQCDLCGPIDAPRRSCESVRTHVGDATTSVEVSPAETPSALGRLWSRLKPQT
jgi:hypothetical protein